MKKLALIILMLSSSGFISAQNYAEMDDKDLVQPSYALKSYQIVYIEEEQYLTEMANKGLDEGLLWSYYLDDYDLLFPLFNSVEQAMANMRGFHPRDFQDPVEGNNYMVYVIRDYCCGDNGNFPNTITLMSDNEIQSSH